MRAPYGRACPECGLWVGATYVVIDGHAGWCSIGRAEREQTDDDRRTPSA